ncbi:MAG: SAV_2336 N-terminal domain-related protein, partial [Pseudanabaena sp. ELA607]
FGDGVISEQGDRNEALENSVSNRESPKQPAQPLRDVDRDRQDENKEDEQNFEVHSKNAQGDDLSTRRSDELQLKIPDARSLQKPLELARSLRPLMRRVPSQVNTLLDEEATVRRIAEEKIWCPVLRPALEPWLDLALVIDDSASMLMWRHTITELQHFLSSYGVFRDVRVWRLGTDKAEKVCIYAGATVSDRNGSPRSPSELIEANGRGLVLVVSDCIAPIWRNGAIAPALQIWSRSGMVAILQMLPDWLWGRTALGRGVAAQFSALAAGIPNYQLTTTTVSTWYDIDLATSIKIPVVTLEPEKFTAWAEMLAGKGGAWSAGIVFEPELFAVPEVAIEFDGASVLDAEDRVQSFRLTASPIARRLAGLLAAAPVISLPIVRILQSKVLTQSQPVHVAEVFLGGLLKPLSEITAKTNPNYVQYDFIEGVRDLLFESVPSSEVVNVVAEFINARLGISLGDFAAVIRNPQQVQNAELINQSKPFALMTAQILKRLGGEYVRFAEEVEQANINLRQRSSTVKTSNLNFNYVVGGSLPPDAPSYVERKCDRDLYEGLIRGDFCYVLGARQTGKTSLLFQTIQRLKADGIACAVISGLGADRKCSEDQWYGSLIRRLANDFQLDFNFDSWWRDHELISRMSRFSEFFDQILLPAKGQNIVIFIDDIDNLLSLEFWNDDFFGFIKYSYERRAVKTEYRRLTFALLGATAPSDLLKDKYRSPFNIGRVINLEGFQFHEVQTLLSGLENKSYAAEELLKEILRWTNGEPFLTQKLCQIISEISPNPELVQNYTVAEWVTQIVRSQIIEHWEISDNYTMHFQSIIGRLLYGEQRAARLLGMYQRIIVDGEIPSDDGLEQEELRLSGLVAKRKGRDNSPVLAVYNPIYAEVFNNEWVEQQLTDLRPPFYEQSFRKWHESRRNENFLLRGQDLKNAELWAEGKSLSQVDEEFLRESREVNSLMVNPFQPLSGMIENQEHFFNREKELKEIFELLNAGTGVELLGDRQIGKSSLLKQIMRFADSELTVKRQVIYCNLQNVNIESEFYAAVCERLFIEYCTGNTFLKAVRDRRSLLLLDEAEKWSSEGFTRQIRDQLRSLSEMRDAPFRLVVATRTSLDQLFPYSYDESITSPFSGILSRVVLQAWDQEKVNKFVTTRLEQTGIYFSKLEMKSLYQDSQGHPQKLMKACFDLYRLKTKLETSEISGA